MEDAAVVDHATRRFGDVLAVDGLSFRVPSGSILGLIGPSGSGKTTTIRMMTGSLEPTEGAVSVLGEEPRRFQGSTRRRIGYMPQLFTLYPDLTARENVDFVASLFGLLLFRRRRRVEEVLRLVDLWDARSRRAGRMSGGMQRRLELACALVHEPVLALLDEPTSGVDPLLRASIWSELRRLRDAGRTLIVTTQVVSEAAECDQVALIAEGHLVALASPEQLRRQATGGDVIQLATDQPLEGRRLLALPNVHTVERIDDRRFRLTVHDANIDTPDIIEAVESTGVHVVAIEEINPSFDEVFARLVERDRAGLTDGPAPSPDGPLAEGSEPSRGAPHAEGTAPSPGSPVAEGSEPSPEAPVVGRPAPLPEGAAPFPEGPVVDGPAPTSGGPVE